MANRRQIKSPDEIRAEFLKRRRTGFGGSDVGAIMGVDKWKDSLDVYLDKVAPPEDIDSPAMERGRMLEPVVSLLYEQLTGRNLRSGKFRRNQRDRFLIGSPDRIIKQIGQKPYKEPENSPGVLEIKTANRFVLKQMQEEGLPKSYLLQLQHYMGLCGTSWGAFAILCPDPWKFITFTVEFDQDLFDRVVEVLRRFWADHVEAQKPPLPKKLDYGDSDEIKSDQAITVYDTSTDVALWEKGVDLYREATAMVKLGTDAKAFARGQLLAVMEGQVGVYQGAGARVYYRKQKGRRTFMEKELRAMQPLDPIAMASLLSKAGMELDDIEAFFEAARLDMDGFVKTGKSFETLRMYDAKEM